MLNLKEKYFLIAKNKFKFNIKQLYWKKKNSAARDAGKIVMRHRGGSLKKKLFILDYFNCYWNTFAYVYNFKYDANRTTLICTLIYTTGVFSYTLAINGIGLGSILSIGPYAKLSPGNTTFLKNIKINCKISLIQGSLFSKSIYVRSNGTYGLLLKKSKYSITIKMPSGILKNFTKFSTATIGTIFNFNYLLFRYKKAGYHRLKGFRPVVRGVATNPVDHPFGGGEGKKSKKSVSMSPWGKLIRGKKTSKKRN